MLNILLQATQTRTGAAIEILVMLVVAAAIGATTVYYYLRSVYTKKMGVKDERITSLQNELDQISSTASQQKIELEQLTSSLKSTEEKLAELQHQHSQLQTENGKHQEQLTDLKEAHDKAVKEVAELKEQLKGKAGESHKADEAIPRIMERKHLIDYNSFGKATEGEKDDLKMISGIGPFIEQRLHALDIYTFGQISKFTKKDIEIVNKVIEYFPGRIERDEWVAQAQELVHSNGQKAELLRKISTRKDQVNYDRIGVANKEEADDLTIISGIGGWIQQKLNALDIYTFRQIASFTPEDEKTVTEVLEYFPGRIDRDEWVPQAQELIHSGGKKTPLFERLKRRKHKIDYSKIGLAHPGEADDLTEIKGIGVFIQEKLNVLDIYTFRQIGNFTKKDVETVTEVIEYFPGRIQRDKWVEQAKALSQQGKLELS